MVFSENAIRMVELKSVDPLEVKQSRAFVLPEGVIEKGKIIDSELLETLMEQCVVEWKIKHKKVQFSVPDPFVITRHVEMKESLSDQEIHGYLYMELGNRIQIPFEEPVFDFVKLPSESGRDIVIFASPEGVVSSYRDLLEKVKLDPVIADISPLALYRYYDYYDMIDEEKHIMFLRFDHKQLTISIFHQGYPLFMRPIAIEEEILEIPYEELYSEIGKIMSFYRYSVQQGNGEISVMYISGDHPSLEDFIDGLREEIKIKIERPFQNDLFAQQIDEQTSGYEIVIGLALKEGSL